MSWRPIATPAENPETRESSFVATGLPGICPRYPVIPLGGQGGAARAVPACRRNADTGTRLRASIVWAAMPNSLPAIARCQ
jgi:hypothetical protein